MQHNMCDYDIPILEPSVDYTKVPSINQKRTIAFINHFITHTVTFLNKFTLSCEEKLFEFENKIQRVEASLAILEARLSSIPSEQVVAIHENENNEIQADIKNEDLDEVETPKQELKEEKSDVFVEPTNLDKEEMQPISSHPDYVKYFKMIHFGVPKPAVKIKMQQDGLDSSVLDNPNQMVPKTNLESNED